MSTEGPPSGLTYESPIAAIAGGKPGKGVKGRKVSKAKELADFGLPTVGSLLRHYPRTYVDKHGVTDLGEVSEGEWLTCFGTVTRSTSISYSDRRTDRPAWRLEAVVESDGHPLALTFFDRTESVAAWRERALAVGAFGMFAGRLSRWQNAWQLANPIYDLFPTSGDAQAAWDAVPDLVPVYPASAKVQSWDLARVVALALDLVDDLPDPLPAEVREAQGLLDLGTALRWIHQPDTWAQKAAAEKRLKLDEALVAQTVLARRRRERDALTTAVRTGRTDGALSAFDARLPFELTAGQRRVGEVLATAMSSGRPLHRLLQGDVGSGKTVVALRAMLQVVDSGGQAVLLAPTEVLAQQHRRSLDLLLGDLAHGGEVGGHPDGTRLTLLTGSLGATARRQALADAASGEAGIVIGTHALLEDRVQLRDLGLVVVDEQHRFGVEQRAALTSKAERPPHLLVMTATPIPRTVAMTVFGDLDVSVLDELPAGREEVVTSVVPERLRPAWLERGWQRLREEVAAGRQAYVVCPRIGDGPEEPTLEGLLPDDLDGPDDGPVLRAVQDVGPALAQGPLAGLRVATLHGQMPAEDKDAIMRAFADGEVDVLVSTTVVEVGVDVPNASVMVILDAERFGVSQLHQLRGRIGRGGHPGLCLLVTGSGPATVGMTRLETVAATRDGFELSRLDLEQRREGNLLGVQQSGGRSDLRLLSVLRDEKVIVLARDIATGLVAEDPGLTSSPALLSLVQALEETERVAFLERG